MDPRGHIYAGTDAEPVTPQDQVRLDGYLRGRAEAELQLHREAVRAALEAEGYEVVQEP